ncbi:hypothetical protein [Paraburkholderia hayleyella]|uniref:hypothetical protein n=1 Tax=Paraburkholderia hayleyella TaxID=2152889 RepID=UPI00129198E8|nr:hypothetical protein [Paraburkholderia hayleyella]
MIKVSNKNYSEINNFLMAIGLATVFIFAGCKDKIDNHTAQPGIGSINGIQVIIPAEYKFFPVQYKGDEIWSNPPVRHAPGPDVPIESFSLLLHYPDFAPLNRSNQASWLGRSGEKTQRLEWITVGINPWQNSKNQTPAAWFKKYIDLSINIEETRFQPGLFFGLQHEKSFKPVNPNSKLGRKEIFYDHDKKSTYIECGDGSNPPEICDHTFIVPEIEAIVDVRYAKENLEHWENIQQKISELIVSFRREKIKKEICNEKLTTSNIKLLEKSD